MSPRPVVLQCEHLAPEAARWLAERCRLVTADVSRPDESRPDMSRPDMSRPDMSRSDMSRSAPDDPFADAEALIIRTYTRVDETLLDRAPKLRVVGRAGVGLDNVDVAACRARGIEVVYTPDANTQAVVEYVFALVADALRPRVRLERAVDADTWNAMRDDTGAGRQLADLQLGILGLGRIGRRVASVAAAFGARVRYNDLLEIAPEERHGSKPADVETLFEKSEVLTVHVDARPGNRGFVGAALIDRMPEDVVFLNTSRGFVVDKKALARFLRAHPRAQAHLDVHEPEPFAADDPLLGLPNAHLYPHLAARTGTALRAMSWVVKDVVAVLEGRQPEFPAPERGY